VSIESPSYPASIQNNTIAYNADTGISKINGGDIIIFNCIIWGNDDQDNHIQLQNCWASYSCIYDHANPGGSCIPDIYGNISCDPLFVYNNSWSDDFHLAADSPCIDLGDPSLDYSLETDIDGDPRKYGLNVDMGADECACDDILNPVDFNLDAIVNQWEYTEVAHAWLCEPADPNWNDICNLDNNNIIDLVDLMLFAQQWLWQPCWTN
jgi:hypothetical protein